jgi:hypothetical protein
VPLMHRGGCTEVEIDTFKTLLQDKGESAALCYGCFDPINRAPNPVWILGSMRTTKRCKQCGSEKTPLPTINHMPATQLTVIHFAAQLWKF